MRIDLPPLRLTGAQTLRSGVLQERTVAIADGRISGGPFPAVDLDGYLVLPGLIDLHGPALDRRPPKTVASAALLHRADRTAAANGVTTSWVSLGWDDGDCPGLASRMFELWARHRGAALTDLRLKVRYERHGGRAALSLAQAVRRHGIDQVTLGDGVARMVPPDGKVPEELAHLAETFDANGVHYGSSGEGDAGAREAFSRIGARICEFPKRTEPALIARATGHTVVGHAGDLLKDGAAWAGPLHCDALASGGDPASLLRCAFSLADRGIMSFGAAWALISERPAEIMDLPDRGRIEQRKRADLAIVSSRTRLVEATIRSGVLIHARGEAFERFRAAGVLASAIAAE